MTKKNILHMLSPQGNISPFDVNMACDAGYDVIIPYTNVNLTDVNSLVQDAIFSRSVSNAKKTGIFICGKDASLALDMMEHAKKAMVPPFEISVFPDPAGSFTTAAAMVACTEKTLKEKFGLSVGYSDHSLGIAVPVAAVALGARIIEKHFTLDRKMEGPDHKASLEPNELQEMVSCIRDVECAIGSFKKQPTLGELKNKAVARKSLVASVNIKEGDIFDRNNVVAKRPGDGLSPMLFPNIQGRIAKKDFLKDEIIEI